MRRKHLNVISVTVLSVYVRLCPFCPLSEEEEDADWETED